MQIYNNALWKRGRERSTTIHVIPLPNKQETRVEKKNYLLQMQNFYKPQSHGEHQQFASVHIKDGPRILSLGARR